MRQIKFKLWNKEKKKMEHLQWLQFTKEPLSGGVLKANTHEDNTWLLPVHYILLQWTGLKDKNGREIYEGDIIKGKHICLDETFLNVVRWEGSGFALGEGLIKTRQLEVIGNIYENSELLKEK